MNLIKLTPRQLEVLEMRYKRAATLDQMAQWLGISRRAVLYRLKNARKRTDNAAHKNDALFKLETLPASHRNRTYSASQLSAQKNVLKLDRL